MKYPVIIIGAGPSGLSIAHYLKGMNIDFIIFEKGHIGNSWRTQRWDDMILNTPNSMNLLPEMDLGAKNYDDFMTSDEFLFKLEDYAKSKKFNLIESAYVKEVRKEEERFIVEVEEADKIKIYTSDIVIVASGAHIEKVVPQFSNKIASGIMQIHSSEFKSSSNLNEGAVLIVGSGQSGMQITHKLIKENRKVFLSTSRVGSIPRNYRGLDIEYWLQETGYYNEEIKNRKQIEKADLVQPQIVVTNDKGVELDWGYLIENGVELLGSLKDVNDCIAIFKNNLADNLKFSSKYHKAIQSMIDEYIYNNSINASENQIISKEYGIAGSKIISNRDTLNFNNQEITNIIWATGLKTNYTFLNPSLINKDFETSYSQKDIYSEGIYFIGVPFQRTRKSGIIFGIVEDAKIIAETIKKNLSLR